MTWDGTGVKCASRGLEGLGKVSLGCEGDWHHVGGTGPEFGELRRNRHNLLHVVFKIWIVVVIRKKIQGVQEARMAVTVGAGQLDFCYAKLRCVVDVQAAPKAGQLKAYRQQNALGDVNETRDPTCSNSCQLTL